MVDAVDRPRIPVAVGAEVVGPFCVQEEQGRCSADVRRRRAQLIEQLEGVSNGRQKTDGIITPDFCSTTHLVAVELRKSGLRRLAQRSPTDRASQGAPLRFGHLAQVAEPGE